MTGRVAFVTGANGISGNAIIEELIRSKKEEWSKIVVTSRKPLLYCWQDPRIEFVAVDFLKPLDSIIKKLSPVCKDVTHAYFTSYVHVASFNSLRDENVPLFENFLQAIDNVAPKLQRVCLQTGNKHYGVHLGPVPLPVNESLGRLDKSGTNFYYEQEDILFELAAKRPWSYNIVRPHAIVGYAPGANGMSQATTAAIYFLICRELGEEPKFPGNKIIYNSLDDSSSATSLADLTLFVTTEERAKNEDFVHTNGDVYMWRYFWPFLASYFGLEVPTTQFSTAKAATETYENEVLLVEWAKDKRPVWDRICAKYGGKPEAFDWGTWQFFEWSLGKRWPTIASNAKAHWVLPLVKPVAQVQFTSHENLRLHLLSPR
ncbi:hypothetical protein KVR01_007051 [Diaporthe batatas]|uniref:uncharacterized protein n=1 Tax=Diaporthe batatas TaxID=748121 RepID=UPI001D03DE41|nr:uncharacterized protein KVR01_007051 [Diaporthe batatas]KAG8163754.1 hypothetical protein KVR01_007051 [Diaporthe batatas]